MDASEHPGWRGPLRPSPNGAVAPTTTAYISGIDMHQQKAASNDHHLQCVPDGVEDFLYWADASTEVVTLCPSKRTEIGKMISICLHICIM